MLINDIADKVNQLGQAWEQYKAINDSKIKQLETKGSIDPLINEQLSRLNLFFDEYKNRVNQLEVAMARPILSSGDDLDSNNLQHKQMFNQYLRKGIDNQLCQFESKALSVGSSNDGGYLVTSEMSKQINSLIHSNSVMRQLASHETISSDSLEFIDDYEQMKAGWTSEIGPIDDTETSKINIHELNAQPKATQKLIDDASIDIEKWLTYKLKDSFAEAENDSFINGDGIGKPRGILSYKDGKNWGEVEQIAALSDGSELKADSIFDLFFALKGQYVAKATFLMHRSMLHQIRKLKDQSSGQYLWHPGLAVGLPATLLGVPVMESSHMPVAKESGAKDCLALVLADFHAAYKIVDRTGIRLLRDPFTDKPFVKFYTTKRLGGDVVNFEAIKILHLLAA